MRRLAVVSIAALAALSACGVAGEQTLAGYCVERFEAMYRDLGIPFETAPEERIAECERFIADEGLTTEADIDAWARVAEEMLTGWSAS